MSPAAMLGGTITLRMASAVSANNSYVWQDSGSSHPVSAADLIIAIGMLLGAGVAVSKLSPTWVAAGFAMWLPANAIADELPVLVALNGDTTAAIVTIAMQLGNVGLLCVPHYSARALICASVGAGLLAFAIAVAPGNIFMVGTAAFFAGFAGSVGSTVLWGQMDSIHVTSFSTGLSLACFVSGAAIMGQQAGASPTFSARLYFLIMAVLYALLVFVARKALPSGRPDGAETTVYDSDNEFDLDAALIDESDLENSQPPPLAQSAFVKMGVLYTGAYSLPALWPFFLKGSAYRYVLIGSNMADTMGRLKWVSVEMHVAIAFMVYMAISSIVALTAENGPELPWIYAIVVAAAMASRGAAITTAQGSASPTDRRKFGYAGQAGSTIGAILGLFVFLIH